MSFSGSVSSLKSAIYWNYAVLFLGISISAYALYVEIRAESDPDYVAFCDLSSIVSCTKALNSKYAFGFGLVGPILGEDHPWNLSNAFYGVIGYFTLALLQFFESFFISTKLTLVSIWIGVTLNLMSIYLFFVLLELRTICLICLTTYTVNGLYLYFAIQRRNSTRRLKRPKFE